MKKILTLSFIVLTGLSVLSANPRNPPKNQNNGQGRPSSHQPAPPKGGHQNHYSNPKNHHNQHNNWNHHNNHGHSHSNHGNYHYNRPVVVHRPVIYTPPRPLIQVHVQSPRPYYNNPVANNRFEFRDFIYTIRNQKFESDKLSIARQGLYNNNFDTYQIKEILSLLDYEESRLEFAKDAYYNCVDKQNYFRINDMFKFSSSVHELENFIYARR